MARDKDLFQENDDITKLEKIELDRYQKYLKSIKKYDPMDEEEYLYLTQELGHIINNNEKLTDIEMLELTRKLEKIENTKDYTIELLELTREIKKITKISKKEIPKVERKENPKKQSHKSLTATSLLPKIKQIPKEKEIKEENLSKKEETKVEERLTFKGLVDKNIKNNPTVEHFDTERIQVIRNTLENRPKPKKKVSKLSKLFWSFTFVLSLCLLIFLIYRFVKWELENMHVESQIDNIYQHVNVVETVSSGAITNVSDLPVVEEEPKEEAPQYTRPNDYWYYMSMSMLNVDFTELKKKNSDTAGWIQVNGSNVNYPYVHTTDNEYYLKHSFDKSYNSAGWVFLDYRNDKNEYGRNNILYAHSRLDNTMFGSLREIITPAWYNNSNNYIIKTSNEKSNALWQVFSVYTIEPESYYIKTKFSDKEFDKFLNTISSRSFHDFNVDLSIEDKILTLSTCYFENKRVVLHAKLIKIEEK